MNEEARSEYMNNHDIPNLIDLFDNEYWKYDSETTGYMAEQLVGEYLEEKE